MNKILFSPPYVDQDVIKEVTETLNSGWITTGPKVKALEEAISKMASIDHTLCVNSWTSGAILVLKWWGIEAGDEVIIPAYTYSATALSVIHAGGTPVMVDVKDDFTIDEEAIKKAITQRTKAIMAVDFGGLMCDYDAIKAIIETSKLNFNPANHLQKQLGRIILISDAAHSIGAFYKGKPSGSAADISIFSFHAVKNITTAEGGAICINLPNGFNNDAIYKEMRLWSLNGQTKDAFTKAQAGGWRYDILFAGLKVNMPDICAAIGLAQMKKYEGQLMPDRERIARRYTKNFESKPWAILPILEDDKRKSCFHLYALRILGFGEVERDRMIEMISDLGISVNVHFIPMPMFTAFKELGYRIEDYPNTYALFSNEVSLPIYPQLTDEQVDRISKAVIDSYNSIRNS